MHGFRGFAHDAPIFLTELGANNNAQWFDQHKTRWQEGLLEPGRLLVDALGPRLQAFDPFLQWSAKVNGSIYTVRRDTRFSNDPRPYKEELGLRFWHGEDRKACRPSFHMRVTSQHVGFGAGVWAFEAAELALFRTAVADENRGAKLVQAIAGLAHNTCNWQKDCYKKVPAPWPQDHPRQELLRQRGLSVSLDVPLPTELYDQRFVDFCAEQFAKLAPVQQWLAEALDG